MTYLHVLIPSRGRPKTVPEMVDAFWSTCTAADDVMRTTALTFVVDSDDPQMRAYQALVDAIRFRRFEIHVSGRPLLPEVSCFLNDPESGGSGMVAALNAAARWVADGNPSGQPPFAIGFMGDDHRPRSTGWDQAYLDALKGLGTGIVYGNDLLQRENLPTQFAVTSDIVRKLGFIGPHELIHMYLDNFLLELGHAADCIRYLPDVIVEHMHPVAGKAEWDENYVRADGHTEHDRLAWEAYRIHQLPAAATAVRSLRTEEHPHG